MPTYTYALLPHDIDPQRWNSCVRTAKRLLSARWNGSIHGHKFSEAVQRRAYKLWYGIVVKP